MTLQNTKVQLVKDTIDKNDINKLIEWLKQDEIPRLTKGDITIELLSELVGELQKWMSQFNKNPSPYLTTMVASTTPLITTLIKVKADLETKTKSKVSKTI